MNLKEVRQKLHLTKTDEAYHRKIMEYQQEQIKLLELELRALRGDQMVDGDKGQ